MDDVLTLLAPLWEQDVLGIFRQVGEPAAREVFGTVRSVTRAEWAAAGQIGRKPELVFVTPWVNYQGEPEALFHGRPYDIYRVYHVQETDEIELYLEEKVGVTNGNQD